MRPIPVFLGVLVVVAAGFAAYSVVSEPTRTSTIDTAASAGAAAGAEAKASALSQPPLSSGALLQASSSTPSTSAPVSAPAKGVSAHAAPATPPPSESSSTLPGAGAMATSSSGEASSTAATAALGPVCNESLIGADGYDRYHMISLAACRELNALYQAGKIAGNGGDLYDNRDGLHVNLCVNWTPNPDCPPEYRLFPQHDWLFSGAVGRATAPLGKPTIGQASWSGFEANGEKYSIPHDMYRSQTGADQLYNLYTNNDLFIYPSLSDDSFAAPSDKATLADPVTLDRATENIANTPYAIASKEICKCGANSERIYDASGSDLPFVELAFAGLAAFRPDVKRTLIARGMLIPTLQALMRYSYRGVTGDDSYVTSPAQRSMYMAHYLSGGEVKPAWDAERLVSLASDLVLSDVPPLPKLSVVSETFAGDERLFTTPGAVARSVAYNAPARTITVSANGSEDVDGSTSGHIFRWEVLQGDPKLVDINVDPSDPGEARITFASSDQTERIDVGVFVKKQNGAFLSVPGIISEYVHP